MQLLDFPERLDEIFFLLINRASCHSLLDPVMLLLINPFTWIPPCVVMVVFMFVKTRKHGWQFILYSLITVAVTESSGSLIKNAVGRLRPCFDTNIQGLFRNLVDCSEVYSFPSSLAANCFGLAAFWYWSLFKTTGKKWKWLWTWAVSICYAQIYVGQHFPSDAAAGALLGITIGTTMAKIFEFAWDSGFDWKKISASVKRKINPGRESVYTTD
ncbi:MAG: phosphatase PAP2 family protein [Ginsengibacter sp.]